MLGEAIWYLTSPRLRAFMSGYPPPPAPGPNPFDPQGASNPFAPQPAQPQFGGLPGYGYQPNYQPPYQPSPPTSLLAVFSMIASAVAPLMFCLCFPTLLLSAAGVIGGHIALYRIQRSRGKLAGSWAAVIALCLGYPVALASIWLLPSFVQGIAEARKADVADDNEGGDRSPLSIAESNILSASDGTAHGNSPEAIALAEEFGTLMKKLREALFTEGKSKISITRGEFVTHCELRDGQCCFLVHVPDYRHFNDDAKESLEELAWMAAQRSVQGKLQPGDRLAVGLKGVLLYGSVQVGTVAAAPQDGQEREPSPPTRSKEKDLLRPFFTPLESPFIELESPPDLPQPNDKHE
jgi:hypothetical protein